MRSAEGSAPCPDARRSLRHAVALFALLIQGCQGCRERPSPPDAGGSQAPDASQDGAAPGEAPSRCTPEGAPRELPGGARLEVGDALVTDAGLVLGAVLPGEAGREGVLLRVSKDLSTLSRVDLGPAGDGDGIPQLFAEGGALLVASYARSASPRSMGPKLGAPPSKATRTLVLSRLEGDSLAVKVRVVQQADESFAFDLAQASAPGGLVAWDEDSDKVVRGLVKVAPFEGAKLGEGIVASPYETDADSPKLARRPGGYWLAWLAREPVAEGDAGVEDKQGAYLETPGEGRSHQWIEIVPTDDLGRAAGKVRRLTSSLGHVASFELVPRGAEVDVLVHDGALRGDGLGTRVFRIRMRDGKAGPPEELVGAGVGASSPTLLGAGAYLTFVDGAERTMLLGLGPDGGLSREGAARSGRLVAAEGMTLWSFAQEGRHEEGPPIEPRAVLRKLRCR